MEVKFSSSLFFNKTAKISVRIRHRFKLTMAKQASLKLPFSKTEMTRKLSAHSPTMAW